MSRITAVYHVRSGARTIAGRAKAIAVEQSVEMPLTAIRDAAILHNIVGEVLDIGEVSAGIFEVRIGLSTATVGCDAGQFLNMLFGNTSLQADVLLHDVEIPAHFADSWGGPRHGIGGLRERAGAAGRALTATALKPQGQDASRLAMLAGKLAKGGLDIIKDDHGLADQAYSPFRERARACAEAVRGANHQTGFRARYVPNLSGSFDAMRGQIQFAIAEGLDTVLIAPMIAGLSNFHRLAVEFSEVAFLAHPAMTGAARIAPPLLLGKLFRLFGADATIYPNYGGRFSFTPQTCAAIADAARGHFHRLRPCLPAPAGGMTLDRVPELLDFYGPDTMLLIGGSLLAAKGDLTRAAAAFASRVISRAHD